MKKKYLLIRDINNKFVAYDKGLVHTKEVWLAAKNWLEIDESDLVFFGQIPPKYLSIYQES